MADNSIIIGRGQDTVIISEEEGGLLTAKFFFSLGAGFLQRSTYTVMYTELHYIILL